jgi:hypothetical protein
MERRATGDQCTSKGGYNDLTFESHYFLPPGLEFAVCAAQHGFDSLRFAIWANQKIPARKGAGDFPGWFDVKRAAPRRTISIKGNHEDFPWLDAQPSPEVLPNLTCLPNGRTIDLEDAYSETVANVGPIPITRSMPASDAQCPQPAPVSFGDTRMKP